MTDRQLKRELSRLPLAIWLVVNLVWEMMDVGKTIDHDHYGWELIIESTVTFGVTILFSWIAFRNMESILSDNGLFLILIAGPIYTSQLFQGFSHAPIPNADKPFDWSMPVGMSVFYAILVYLCYCAFSKPVKPNSQ